MSKLDAFTDLVGHTIVEIAGAEKGSDEIVFTLADGSKYRLYHRQDCCEFVAVEDITGDVGDLIGTPVLSASEESEDGTCPDSWGSATWTFYRIGTINGTVVIRWLGASNGYYSERVDWSAA